MEIKEVIEYLSQQRAMIDKTITCLERLSEPAERRGRKFLNAEDRQKVSERMKKYWASRRLQNSLRTQNARGSA